MWSRDVCGPCRGVASAVVANRRGNHTFLSRRRKGSRIGDEWTLEWTSATRNREGIGAVVWSREQEATALLNAPKKKEETQMRQCFARDGVKGDGVTDEASGGGRGGG